MNRTNTDPLLTEDESRYVMFPIQDQEIWEMYKKQVACFWTPEEIDLSKDLRTGIRYLMMKNILFQ